MADNFDARLDAALKTGRAHSRRRGASVKAAVLRLMDDGEADGVTLLVRALAIRGELPEWLSAVPLHEVEAVLSAWGSVRHAMAQWRRAQQKKEQNK